jgi:putative ABC transport system permease protein
VRAAGEQGVDLLRFVGEFYTLRYYEAGVSVGLKAEGSEGDAVSVGTRFMKLSDFNAILAMQGIEPVTLSEGEYAVDSGMGDYWPDAIRRYMEGGVIELRGEALHSDPSRYYGYALETHSGWGGAELTVIVRDELLKGLPVKGDALMINYPSASPEYEAQCRSALSGLSFSAPEGFIFQKTLETKARALEDSNSATTTIAYMAVYLGVVFLIASAAVLAIAQLSESSDNIHRYGLLRKIGTEEKMLNGALFAQILIYFGVPLLLALVHSAAGISMAGRLTSVLGDMSILGSSIVTTVVIVFIYGAYFLATYWGGRNIINRSYASGGI